MPLLRGVGQALPLGSWVDTAIKGNRPISTGLKAYGSVKPTLGSGATVCPGMSPSWLLPLPTNSLSALYLP